MDEKLLDALNNLSNALTEIADIMSDKTSDKDSDVSKALVSGNLSEQINGISEGIKSIKSDTTKILSNQQTLLSMAKEKGDKDDFAVKVGGDENKKSMMKDGLATIMLIAVAVVALGAAFNLIGDVPIGSVIALSIAIPILAFSFIKISEMAKKSQFDPIKDGLSLLMTVVGISLAVVAASLILGMVKPIGLAQLFTTILIAGMFAAIGFSLGSILSGFKDISLGDAIKASFLMPLLFPAIALAIVGSSFLLGAVQPIGLMQLFTAFAISLLFVPLGFAAGMMIKSFKGIEPEVAIASMILLPIIMVGMSTAIMMSSYLLSAVQPIGLMQFLTAVAISIVFIPLAVAAGVLVKLAGGLDIKDMVTIPITMVLMSTAVMLSSHILAQSTEIGGGKLWNIVLMGLTLSIIGITMGSTMYLLSKMGGPKDFLNGSLSIIIISTAIMISSHILALGNYSNYPSFGWAIGVGLSIISFGIPVLIFGLALLATGPIGLLALAGGALATVIIATTVMLSSHILNKGNYDKYPTFQWALGSGFSMVAFGMAMLALGTLMFFTGGAGYLLLAMGSAAIFIVAATVSATSHILATGNYDKYPTFEWALGSGFSMVAFGMAMLVMGTLMFLTLGGGYLLLAMGSAAIFMIATTISITSHILATGNYDKYPTFEWAFRSGFSLVAFGMSMLYLGTLMFLTGGAGYELLAMGSVAIFMIAATVSITSHILATGNYDKYPTFEWAVGTGLSLVAFGMSMLYLGSLMLLTLGGGYLLLGMGAAAIFIVAYTISETSHILATGDYKSGPTKEWALSAGSLMIAFGGAMVLLGVLSSIPFVGGRILEAGSEAVLGIASTIVLSSYILSAGDYKGGPTKEWAESISKALGAFAPVYEILLKNSGFFSSGVSVDDFREAIRTISEGIADASNYFSGINFEGGPTSTWARGVGGAIAAFAPVYEILLKNSGFFSSGVSVEDFKKAINTIADGIVEVSGRFKGVSFEGGPTGTWARGVGSAIKAFSPIFKLMSGVFSKDADDIRDAILTTTDTMIEVGKRFSKNPDIWNSYPKQDWINGIKSSVHGLASILSGKNKVDLSVFEDGLFSSSPITKISDGIIKMASAFDRLGKSIQTFNTSLSGMNLDKVNALKMLTGNIAILSALDSDMFDDMLDVLEDRADVFADLLKQQYEGGQLERPSVSSSGTADKKSKDAAKKQSDALMKKIDTIIAALNKISKSSSNIDTHLTSKIEKDKKMI